MFELLMRYHDKRYQVKVTLIWSPQKAVYIKLYTYYLEFELPKFTFRTTALEIAIGTIVFIWADR